MDPDLPELTIADVVISTAGHDAGTMFYVLEADDTFLLLADGKSRKVESPKRKKRRHVISEALDIEKLSNKFNSEETITNSELRKALAVYRDEVQHPDQEG